MGAPVPKSDLLKCSEKLLRETHIPEVYNFVMDLPVFYNIVSRFRIPVLGRRSEAIQGKNSQPFIFCVNTELEEQSASNINHNGKFILGEWIDVTVEITTHL